MGKKLTALRYNQGKPKWSLVHYESLLPLVRVLEYGCQKYEPFNWQKSFETRELLDSLMRHVVAIMDGEVTDKESGLPHIGHVMANAMFYSYHNEKIHESDTDNDGCA